MARQTSELCAVSVVCVLSVKRTSRIDVNAEQGKSLYRCGGVVIAMLIGGGMVITILMDVGVVIAILIGGGMVITMLIGGGMVITILIGEGVVITIQIDWEL